MKLNCNELKVDNNHNVLILQRANTYDCYVMAHDQGWETPYVYMFGLPLHQQPYYKVVDLAIQNAPDYYQYLFTQEDVNQ